MYVLNFDLATLKYQEVKDGFAQMPSSLDTAIKSSTEFQTSKNVFITDLQAFCPNSVGDVGGINPTVFTQNVITSLQAIPDLATDSAWDTYNSSLSEMNDFLDEAVSVIGFLESPRAAWFLSCICASAATALLILYLLAGGWRSGKEGYEFAGEEEHNCTMKFLHLIAIPLFSVLMAWTWFVTAVSFTTSAANSDFCYSEITTGDTVLGFLRNLKFAETSEFYKRADDYLHVSTKGITIELRCIFKI